LWTRIFDQPPAFFRLTSGWADRQTKAKGLMPLAKRFNHHHQSRFGRDIYLWWFYPIPRLKVMAIRAD
jgi:hypothetical protein